MINSASGDVSGPLVFAGFGRAEDFPRRIDGAVALVERGAQVTFRDKVAAARGAGAVAVVIYNSTEPEFNGSLQAPSEIPALAISGASGQHLRQRLAAGALDGPGAGGGRRLAAPGAERRRPPPREPGGAAPAPGAARTVVVGAHFELRAGRAGGQRQRLRDGSPAGAGARRRGQP